MAVTNYTNRARVRPKNLKDKIGVVGHATFVIGAETSNAITVNIQLRDQYQREIKQRAVVQWYIFGDANGDTLATALTSVAAGTDGWASTTVTGLRGEAGSEADGDIDLVLTQSSGAKTVYLGIKTDTGEIIISGPCVFAA